MYQEMEWRRIADENIVRVVETAIFRKVLGDGDQAFDWILKNEIQFSGMPRLQALYDSLTSYESNRDVYQTIDSYLPELISVMFQESNAMMVYDNGNNS